MVVDRLFAIAALVGGAATILARAAKIEGVEVLAIGEIAAQARLAMAAPHEGQDDMVPGGHFFHTASDLLYNARAFMPEYNGQRHVIKLVARHHVRVAHP